MTYFKPKVPRSALPDDADLSADDIEIIEDVPAGADEARASARAAASASAIPFWSDDALADELVDTHGEDMRHVHLWGRWLLWDGTRWRQDDTLRVFDLARRLCRDTAVAHPKLEGQAKKALGDAATFAAVERVARSDRRVALTADGFDADPMLLNTPGGTVDLRTGVLHEHRRDDLITKATAVSPAPTADCPLWLKVLARVTGADPELQAYLQRLFGYALTGITSEHMLAFFYGGGANGKSTVLNAITGAMGDYAAVASMDVFQASQSDRHPTELAMLRGARIVTAQETEEGRRWAESRIKTLTGGDPVTARFMKKDFFTYTPQFTLILAGNHKPQLRTVDEAIRRRLHMVPFTVHIPAAERDTRLSERLKAEWPAILRWAIDGCLTWQGDGLAAPEAVTKATAEYFTAADLFATWLDECCERAAHSREDTGELFASWKRWAEAAGEHVGNLRTFGDAMARNGFEGRRDPHTRRKGWAGVRLLRQDYTDDCRYGG